MKQLTDLDREVVELTHSLPHNVVVICANIGGMRLHQILKHDEIKKATTEVQELVNYYDHDPEDDK
jgi:hypothetical protein